MSFLNCLLFVCYEVFMGVTRASPVCGAVSYEVRLLWSRVVLSLLCILVSSLYTSNI